MNVYRFATEWIRGLKRDPRQLLRKSRTYECPLCGFRGWFIDAGDRPDARCPNCGSRERERIIGLYWRRVPWEFAEAKVLHFSPEKAIWPLLKRYPGYVSSDVVRHKRAARIIDIQAISEADQSFDYLLCNHVLEHVVRDRDAVHECFRVLKPGGIGLFSVPIATDRAETWNPPEGMAKEEIERICGRWHVRLYGMDFPNLLEEAGFEVSEIDFNEAEDERYRLRSRGMDKVYVAERPR